MHQLLTNLRTLVWVALSSSSLLVSGCGGEAPPGASGSAAPISDNAPAAPATASAAGPETLQPTEQTWTPEALEDLLAPVALYPDILLGQVLVASTNPQEVLDAGNWLLQNESLEGRALDDAAKGVGFTPPMRALMQSRDLVDMMCSEMGWTTEIGQAYVNDQIGLLDAVQRLRKQAKDAGNLASSDQMKVETIEQEGQEVITVSPPSKEVIYVPQYNPVTVYQPAPVATTGTTTVVQQGHSTAALVTTGLLSFGAGLLVAEIFDDDDDDWYRPHYHGRPMPYYPPYPYRPYYGGGFRPGHGYYRPPGYKYGFNNNTIININKQNNVYWNRYDNKRPTWRGGNQIVSPITTARRGNRPELAALNARALQGPARKAPGVDNAWKGRSSYAGANRAAPRPKVGREAPGAASKIATAQRMPKVQGSYAGAQRNRMPENRPSVQRPAVQQPARQQANRVADRGRPSAASSLQSRPSTPRAREVTAPARTPDRSAISGSGRGQADRAASQRGKQSLSHGAGREAGRASRRVGR
jgi:hypothetical protein